MPDSALPAMAAFGDLTARNLVTVTSDPASLAQGGRWAVAIDFEGGATLARFADWTPGADLAPDEVGSWVGPRSDVGWDDSLPESGYCRAVAEIRRRIAAGDVYQVNLCRRLSTRLPDATAGDPAALWQRLRRGNPAPYGGFLRLPQTDTAIASASPELFLRVAGDDITSGPIKGTAADRAGLSDKDRAENVMIVDLVRNDLSRVCRAGSVSVPQLLRVEAHPGLVHLASYIHGRLRPDVAWPDILAATFPPGSVSGAPKLAALRVIHDLEPVARQAYCGAFGWIDVDAGRAELAVAIRTFWITEGAVHFGTGAGITWGSDPAAEWAETDLKARRLIALAGDDPSLGHNAAHDAVPADDRLVQRRTD